ncbi:MAG: glycosyltransferase [Gemmatimonadota bacterium]
MNVLVVANFPSNTGYAWKTIEEVFRGLADRWLASGREVLVTYPSLASGAPEAFSTSAVQLLEFDYERTRGFSGLSEFVRLIRRHKIDLLYLTDQQTWSWRYLVYRLAGVRTLIVHDRTSGTRTFRRGLLGAFKRLVHRIPGVGATAYIGISRFVADRLRGTGTPADRTFVAYNGIPVETFGGPGGDRVARVLEVPAETPIVFTASRAQPYKGIATLIEAAALLIERGDTSTHFAYCGDGPGLGDFKALAASRGLTGRFHFLGRRDDVATLLGAATVAVVPSEWAEAFGLSVVEAMAAGVAVVATAVGGIPELIEPGVTGVLVPPGAPNELASALRALLDDPAARARMASAARRVACERFTIARVVADLGGIIEQVEPRA